MRYPQVSVLAFVFAFFLLSGCTSLQPMDENLTRAQVVETINIGEEISILTKTGETFNLTVKELNQDAIIGVKKTVKFDDIETIDNQQFSALNTTGAVVGGYLGIGAILTAVFFAIL